MNEIMTRRYWTEGPGSFVLAILIALTIRWAFMEAYVIPSGSMEPTLLVHDHIFVDKFRFGLRVPFTESWMYKRSEPQRGDVIVFKYPENMEDFFIKRVVGIPGDKIFYENGNLYINDKVVDRVQPNKHKDELALLANVNNHGPNPDEEFDHFEQTIGEQTFSVIYLKGRASEVFGPVTVPPGQYFVMGDNRNNSRDSRFWAADKRFVPYDNLVGRAMFVWLSCDTTIPMPDLPILRDVALCNPMTIRWGRFFHSIHE